MGDRRKRRNLDPERHEGCVHGEGPGEGTAGVGCLQATLPAPRPWTSSLQNCGEINFYYLSLSVWGLSLWQPQHHPMTELFSTQPCGSEENLALSLGSINDDLIDFNKPNAVFCPFPLGFLLPDE